MKSFLNLLSAEQLKMSRSFLWLLVPASPLLALLIGLLVADGQVDWAQLIGGMSMFHAMLFLPVLSGMFASFVCRFEHSQGGWKSLLTLPVSRTAVYAAKYVIVMVLLAITQILMLAVILAVAGIRHVPGDVPWDLLLRSLLGGWVACLPLAALQMFVSTLWVSFAAPLVLNVIFTIPNILIVQSPDYGPYYPWGQPFLAMMPRDGSLYGAFNLPFENLMITVLGSLVLFLGAGLVYFNRKEF